MISKEELLVMAEEAKAKQKADDLQRLAALDKYKQEIFAYINCKIIKEVQEYPQCPWIRLYEKEIDKIGKKWYQKSHFHNITLKEFFQFITPHLNEMGYLTQTDKDRNGNHIEIRWDCK